MRRAAEAGIALAAALGMHAVALRALERPNRPAPGAAAPEQQVTVANEALAALASRWTEPPVEPDTPAPLEAPLVPQPPQPDTASDSPPAPLAASVDVAMLAPPPDAPPTPAPDTRSDRPPAAEPETVQDMGPTKTPPPRARPAKPMPEPAERPQLEPLPDPEPVAISDLLDVAPLAAAPEPIKPSLGAILSVQEYLPEPTPEPAPEAPSPQPAPFLDAPVEAPPEPSDAVGVVTGYASFLPEPAPAIEPTPATESAARTPEPPSMPPIASPYREAVASTASPAASPASAPGAAQTPVAASPETITGATASAFQFAPSAPRPTQPAPTGTQSPQPAPTPAHEPKPVAAPTPGPDIADLRARYGRDLGAIIEQRKTYPRRAQRRREQGTVEIRFRLDASGKVMTAALVRETGLHTLEASALDLIRERIGQFPPPPPELGDALEFTVPIRYRLE